VKESVGVAEYNTVGQFAEESGLVLVLDRGQMILGLPIRVPVRWTI